MEECDYRENCRSYQKGSCWYCNDWRLYNPIDLKIKTPRQKRIKEERQIRKDILKRSEASKRGKRSKKKGYAGEAEVTKLLNSRGIDAKRVPLSGSLKSDELSCDIVLGNGKRIEVKRRKSGLTTIRKWLNEDPNSSYVFFREDGDKNDWLVTMPVDEFIELAKGGEK